MGSAFNLMRHLWRLKQHLKVTVKILIIRTDTADQTVLTKVSARGYKIFSMLNSAEHGILNAHMYQKYEEIQRLSGSDKHRMIFFMLIKC